MAKLVFGMNQSLDGYVDHRDSPDGLIPSIDGTIFGYDAPACAWRQLYSLLE
nr:hypothetical protein [Ktedonobacteraceae bacterium]